ncbi:MAG: type II secretion system F family protein [Bacillaceae bacterium]|nr:type II secretion system F family protein [Bacillaceae bacterium]
MTGEPVVLAAVSFVLLTFVFGLSAGTWSRRRNRLKHRLDHYLSIGKGSDREASGGAHRTRQDHRRWLYGVVKKTGKPFAAWQSVRKWEEKLIQAAIPLRTEEFFAVRLLSAGTITLFFWLLVQDGVFLLILVAFIGYMLPVIFVNRRRTKRLARCSVQLSEALGTMANAMRAGFSFMQAMQLIGKEVPDPLGPEFDRAIREVQLGVSLEEAFANLERRLPDDDLHLVLTSLLIQRTTGGNLADLLETMQETIRGRVRIKEELRTLTAQGRMSSWIISLLPPGVGIYLYVMNPEYFMPLLTHPLGWLMLGCGTITGITGWLFIRKIVRIEV